MKGDRERCMEAGAWDYLSKPVDTKSFWRYFAHGYIDDPLTIADTDSDEPQPGFGNVMGRRGNILVVDDRPEDLVALRSVLDPLRQNIVVAQSGEEALRRVLEQNFAVILLDVHMPNLDGLETAALIRERKKSANTPIIFVTAYVDEQHMTRGYSLGAVDYIFSPVVPEILQAKVRVFVELSRMTEQVKQQAEQNVALAKEQAARAAAEESVHRARFLAHASATLASSLDLDATLRAAVGAITPSVADMCAITLIDATRANETLLGWTDDQGQPQYCSVALISVPSPALVRGIENVIADRAAKILTDLDLEEASGVNRERPPPTHLLPIGNFTPPIFPLQMGGRIRGALSFGINRSRRPFTDSDSALAGDLTERVAIAIDKAALYQEVRDSDRRKTEFLAMLGHELRNPLTPIHYALEILSLNNAGPVKHSWARSVVKRQVQQLTRLVDDLLDVSRITQGKIQLNLAPVEVTEIVDTALETSRPLVDSRNHELVVTLPTERITISADATRVAQVLSNLLNNAAKFTKEGGHIEVSAVVEDGTLVFRVSDSGIGMVNPEQTQIFELFSQVEGPYSSQRGLGIGLNLVRRLVELHGGTVSAYSPGPNQGSVFTVRLPLNSVAETGEAAVEDKEQSSAESSGSLRVLVVDDNVDVAESTAELLNMAGYEMHVEHDGPAALKAVSSFRPDLILLDIGMPGMDGFEVARRLRAEFGSDWPILIAISGYGQDRYLRQAKEVGFDRCLVKPVDASTLPELLAGIHSGRTRGDSTQAE